MLGISLLAVDVLASQEGLCSMGLFWLYGWLVDRLCRYLACLFVTHYQVEVSGNKTPKRNASAS